MNDATIFELVLLVVIGTSIWVLFDASTIGVKKGQLPGLANMGPAGWFFACLGLWVISFPVYLAKRSELKRLNDRGKVPRAPVGPATTLAPDFDEQLRKLAKLKAEGIISEEDFFTRKRAILGIGSDQTNPGSPSQFTGSKPATVSSGGSARGDLETSKFWIRHEGSDEFRGPFTREELTEHLGAGELAWDDEALEARGQSYGALRRSPDWSSLRSIVPPTAVSTAPQAQTRLPKSLEASASRRIREPQASPSKKQCPYCGKEYPEDASVCDIDGNALIKVEHPTGSGSDDDNCSYECSDCSAELSPNDVRCPKCGADVTEIKPDSAHGTVAAPSASKSSAAKVFIILGVGSVLVFCIGALLLESAGWTSGLAGTESSTQSAGSNLGVAGSQSPTQADIDDAVDWRLEDMIRRKNNNRKLFDSYKITNHYVEQFGDERHFVFDFEAQCKVVYAVQINVDSGAQSNVRWQTPGPFSNPTSNPKTITETFNSSVTMVKKGQKWYPSRTIR